METIGELRVIHSSIIQYARQLYSNSKRNLWVIYGLKNCIIAKGYKLDLFFFLSRKCLNKDIKNGIGGPFFFV